MVSHRMLVQSMVIFFLGIIDNVCRLHYSDPEFVLVEQHPQEKCIICRTHCVAFQMDVFDCDKPDVYLGYACLCFEFLKVESKVTNDRMRFSPGKD